METLYQPLAATLLHFLWQGALLATLYWIVQRCTTSPEVRYAAGVSLSVTALIWPVATWIVVSPAAPAAPAVAWGVGLPEPLTRATESSSIAFSISLLWSVGASTFFLRTLGLLSYLRFALWRARRPLEAPLMERVRHWQRELGLRHVRIWMTERVDVPQIVGYLLPVIYLPTGMMVQLNRMQIDSILLHELVHLRRRDHWVLAIQNVLEVLFFYHPAVWWLSDQLHHEREFCCDRDVVRQTGSRLDYARALMELESSRAPQAPALRLNGGSLMNRIRKIMDPTAHPSSRRARPAALLTACLLALVVSSSWFAADVLRGDSGPIAWMPAKVQAWDGLLIDAGKRHSVDPALLSIIALLESGGDAQATSRLGARGLMQIMPKTGEMIARSRGIDSFHVDQLMDPAVNADFGAWLLSRYLDKFESDVNPGETVEWAAAAYNAGMPRVKRHKLGEQNLSEETMRYKAMVRKLWTERKNPDPDLLKQAASR